MIGFGRFVHRARSSAGGCLGVTSAEYPVLAVGMVVAVARAIAACDSSDPLTKAAPILPDASPWPISGTKYRSAH